MLIIIVTGICAIFGSSITIIIINHNTKYGSLEISSTEEVDTVRLNLDTLEGLSKKKRIVLNVKVIK